MFLDIRDFSRYASAHSAPEVVSYLNALFGFMIPLVNQHHGMVNKFLGDGFMAVFGAPLADTGECDNAVRASLAILRRLQDLNTQGAIPPTRIGIGLHVGEAATGNVGTAERKEYTIIGDVVNVASRIEQATKLLGAQLLVSAQVASKLDARGGFQTEDMGLVELKGQPQPLRLFKLA
jgi:adenylate cyclase